jgi:hypothetical protein
MLAVGRFTEYSTVAFGHGIATQDEPFGTSQRHIPSLLVRESRDEFWRSFAAADTTFGRGVGGDHTELETGFLQQPSAARRAAGQDQWRRGKHGHKSR